MGRILFVTLCIFFSSFLYAQPHVEKSEVFEVDPFKGWMRTLQLKNGNTFFFQYAGKSGVSVTFFDKSRKMISDKNIKSAKWDYKGFNFTAVSGVYEISNEAVVFLTQLSKQFQVVYRLRFNANTGNLISEEEVGRSPSVYFSLFGRVAKDGKSSVFVEKDPASDCYAIIYFNSHADELNEQIKVAHYDGSHKLINLAYYASPNKSYKFINYIGAVVDGSKRVFISTYGAESEKGKEANVYVACLNTGDSIFMNKKLEFSEDFKDTKSVMQFNRNTNTIQMLTNTLARHKTGFKNASIYVSFLSYIDPESLALKGVNVIGNEKVNEYVHHTLGLDMDYTGMPQQMIINPDNSTTVLQEEMTVLTTYSSKGGVSRIETVLGNIGVTEIASDGTEKYGYAIMKRQLETGTKDALYMEGRNKGIWDNDMYASMQTRENQYKSFDYIFTEKNHYLLFNDIPQNITKNEDEKKRKNTNDISKLNTIYYSLENGKVNKHYLFGEPTGKKESTALLIEASHYMKSTNTYATLMTERKGRKWTKKIAWIHFD